ncbi:WD40 repeat domain-containing protein [Candidatus Leptofilum sp.]|uniref:nSTAND1 domain-containing NTPase n=1 Tax=Candidatus Leptofilum sp. TaxID=3241576 RepID=UPI003B5C1C47
MTNQTTNKLPPDLSRLRHLLVEYFSLSEIRTLCLDLGVRYDDLGGEGITAKVRELLHQLDRTKRIEALLQYVEPLRPKVDWRGGPLPEAICPYKGLHAFGEADKDNFFGRDAFTQKLVGAVDKQSLVAVVGPSGSGKSSVVYAGLLPALRRKENWLILHFRPGNDPFLALAKALLPLLDPDVKKMNIPRIARRELKPDLGGENKAERIPLADYFQQIQEENPDSKLLLIVDQFEELYTQVDEAVRRDFLDVLLAAGFGTLALDAAPQPFATLLLTMRADFMGQALAYPPMVAALQDNDVKIGLMSREELSLAIEQPALNQGVHFADGLVTRILEDVGDHAGNLPLLEFALTLLWGRQTNREMTHEAYEAIGGVSGALAQHADETLAKLTQDDAEKVQAIQRVMVQLVQPGAGAEDTRRVARRADLGDSGWNLAQRLAAEDARLLVTGQENNDADTAETVEVIHEALIQNWGQLQTWMETDREFRMWQERLRSDLTLWQKNEKKEGFLLQGAPLTVAADWLQKRGDELQEAKEEIAFIEASVQRQQKLNEANEDRRQRELQQAQQLAAEQQQRAESEKKRAEEQQKANRQLRRFTAFFLVMFIVAIVAAIGALYFARQANQEGRLAEARALAAEANQWLAAERANQGLVNAYQAVRTTYDSDEVVSAEAHSALVNSLAQVRAQAVLEGHTDVVWSAAFNGDGTRIVTASDDSTVRLWDREGELVAVLEGHTDVVRSAAFNPAGTWIVTASDDGTARLWDAKGEMLTVLEGHTDVVWSATFNSDGTRVVTASSDGTARLWDAKGEMLTVLEGHTDVVWSATFNSDGTRVVTASSDGTARLWDAKGEMLTVLEGHTDVVNSAAFNPAGTWIVTASDDGTARLWDAEGGLVTVLEGHTRTVNSAAFSPDGTRIVTASYDRTARLWDAEGRLITVLEGHTDVVWSAMFNLGGTRIVTVSSDRTARLWDAEGELVTVLEGHTSYLRSATFNSGGTRIVTASSDRTARLWDAEGGLVTVLEGHTDSVLSAAFSLDGTRIVTASSDGTERLWDAEGELVTVLEGHTTTVNLATFSLDRTARRQILAVLKGRTDGVLSAAFSPDGTRIVTTRIDGTAPLWDAQGWVLTVLEGHTRTVNSAMFNPDGTRIVTASDDGTARLWDATGEPVTVLEGHTDVVNSAAFSPNGTRIVTASDDGTARLWDAEGGLVTVLEGHTNGVLSAAFNPAGTRIVTASDDGTARLWDAEGGLVTVLEGHTDVVNSAAFSPDGTRIVTASDDGTARLWRTYPTIEATLAEAERKQRLVLTAAECEQYFAEFDPAFCEGWEE